MRFTLGVMGFVAAAALVAFGASCAANGTGSGSSTSSTSGGGDGGSVGGQGGLGGSVGGQGGLSGSSSGQGGDGGSSSGQGGDGGSTACQGLGDSCTDCSFSNCQQTYCACWNDADCQSLGLCMALCQPNDLSCAQNCYTTYENGVSLGALAQHCASQQCANACPSAGFLDACDLCLFNHCPTQMNSCFANPDCVALVTCLDGCSDQSCETACFDQHTGGATDGTAVVTCGNASCATECS